MMEKSYASITSSLKSVQHRKLLVYFITSFLTQNFQFLFLIQEIKIKPHRLTEKILRSFTLNRISLLHSKQKHPVRAI